MDGKKKVSANDDSVRQEPVVSMEIGDVSQNEMIPPPPDDQEMRDVSNRSLGDALPQRHVVSQEIAESTGGQFCALTKSKITEGSIESMNDEYVQQRIRKSSITITSSQDSKSGSKGTEESTNDELKYVQHRIRLSSITLTSSQDSKSGSNLSGQSNGNANNIDGTGVSKSTCCGSSRQKDLDSGSPSMSTAPKNSAYFPNVEPHSSYKGYNTPANLALLPSKLSPYPPKLLTPEERDSLIMPKIEELKSFYKAALEKASDIYVTHNKQSEKATAELRRFLSNHDHIDGQRKIKESIEQFEKWLNMEIKIIERNRKVNSKPDKKIADPKIQENSISISTTHKINDDCNSKMNITLETNLDEIPPMEKDQTNQVKNFDTIEPMDTTENDTAPIAPTPDSQAVISSPPPSLWMNEVISAYGTELNNFFQNRCQNNLFLSPEDFKSAQKESVKKVNKQLTQLLNKCNFPIRKNGIPSVLKDEKGQQNIHKFVMDSETTAEFDAKMKNENARRRSLLEKFTQQYHEQLKSKAPAWIRQLTDIRIRFPDKYDVFLNRTLKEVSTNSHYKERSLLESALRKNENFRIGQESLCHLEKCLDSYRKEMEKKFEMNRSFSDSKFVVTQQSIYDSTITEFKCQDENAQELLIIGLNHLKEQFWERNKSIQQHEINAAERLFPLLANFYREIMADVTKGKFFAPDQLKELHKLVAEETLEVFWKSCDFKSNQEIPKTITSTLEQNFEQHLKTFENDNKIKTEKIRTGIRILLAKHRKLYNEHMDEILPSRGPSQDEKELAKKHNEKMKEICKLLKMEITQMEVQIPFEEHVATLTGNMEQDWVELQKLNERLKQKDAENAMKKDREAKKLEAEAVVEQEKIKRNEKMAKLAQQSSIGKSSSSSVSSPPSKALESCSTPIVPTHSAGTVNVIPQMVVLPPIAIEFSLTLVRVGWMNNGFQMIKNSWMEETTPTLIAVKEDGDILIGDEAKDESRNISLADIFAHPHTQEFQCYVDGKIQKLRSEVLVALFLARIKADVEGQLNGQWITVTISVPLFFNSVQRQAMKDSASLAGFESVQLINDTTAAAFCYTKTEEFNLDNMLLVGVAQNHGPYFDAALYEWKHSRATGLELISHATCGNLHSPAQVSGLLSKFTTLKKQLTKWWSGEEEVTYIRNMIKTLVGVHKDETSSVCVNYKFDDTFDNIINHYSRLVSPEKSQGRQLYIIMGAAMFSNDSFKDISCGKRVSIKDRASYIFERTTINKSSSRPAVFNKYQQLLPNSKVKDEHTISGFSKFDMRLVFTEVSLENIHPVGQLVVKPNPNAINTSEFKVKFTLSNEGIFAVYKVCTSNPNWKLNKDLDFDWYSPNLKPDQLKELKMMVKRMIKDEKKEAFEKAKKELQALVEDIQLQINNVKSAIGKLLLEKEVLGAQALLNHAKMTIEQINSKTALLLGLKSKYCP